MGSPPSMLLYFLLLFVGLVVLYLGAEWLVDGAAKLALGFGVSPMIIGLTVVAAATSAPEFVVSLFATLDGSPDLALGNVVGSNVANIALIVGASALLLPMTVDRTVLGRDFPFMVTAMAVALATAYIGHRIDRLDGIILVLVGMAFLGVCLRLAHQQSRRFRATGKMDSLPPEHRRTARHIGKIVVGVAGLLIGARLMVDNAVEIARAYGISELVIGVTVVALGTSLPELATAVAAALKKEPDISLGNILGSNIFNTAMILGGVAVVRPIDVSAQALAFDLPAMAGISILLFPFLRVNYRVSRLDGAILLLAYAAYVATSAMHASGRLF